MKSSGWRPVQEFVYLDNWRIVGLVDYAGSGPTLMAVLSDPITGTPRQVPGENVRHQTKILLAYAFTALFAPMTVIGAINKVHRHIILQDYSNLPLQEAVEKMCNDSRVEHFHIGYLKPGGYGQGLDTAKSSRDGSDIVRNCRTSNRISNMSRSESTSGWIEDMREKDFHVYISMSTHDKIPVDLRYTQISLYFRENRNVDSDLLVGMEYI